MNKKTKNTKYESDSESSEEVPITKKTVVAKKNASPAKRKASVTSEESKPKKKVVKKPVDSDSESEPKAKKTTKVSKKKADSDDESEEKPKKQVKKVVKKADSDSESEVKPKKQEKKVVKKADSDDESEVVDVPMKNIAKKAEEHDAETHTELFARNLSFNSTEDTLWEAFSKFGTVETVKVLYDKFTGKAKGLAFIKFEKRADAKKALENIGDVDGRTPTLSWSNEKKPDAPRTFGGEQPNKGGYRQEGFQGQAHTVFVGNLSFKSNENSVKNFFSKVGNVVGVRIAKHEDGKQKGFCHVDFDTSDAATAAVGLAGQNLDGREVRVDMSQPRTGGAGGAPRGGRGGFASSKPSHGRLGDSQGKKVTFDDDDE